MLERATVHKISVEDLKFLSKDYGVHKQTVLGFLKAGVPQSEVDDVLDMRNILASYNKDGKLVAQVSTSVVIRAYKAAHGDLGTIELMIDKAQDIANTRASKRTAIPGFTSTSDFNNGLSAAINIYNLEGVDGLE